VKLKGYTIMEMLAVLAALVVMMALLTKPMHQIISELPRSYKDYQTLTQTLHMLKHLQEDVEHSDHLSVIEMDPRISSNLLILKQAGGLVSYCLADGKVVRQSNLPRDRKEDVWELPNVYLKWIVWKNEQGPIALELAVWNERPILGQSKQKFQQTHVYFIKKEI